MTRDGVLASRLLAEEIRLGLGCWVESPVVFEALEAAIEEQPDGYLEAWR